jgi:hypothetical protein
MTKQRKNRENNMTLLVRHFCTRQTAMQDGDCEYGNMDTFLRDAREDSAENTQNLLPTLGGRASRTSPYIAQKERRLL